MLRKTFLASVSFVLCALGAEMILLGGCGLSTPPSIATIPLPTPVPTSTPVPKATISPAIITPVPIATWVAQGIPEDTMISYDWDFVISQPYGTAQVTILADGTVTYKATGAVPSWYGGSSSNFEQRGGQISQDELKRILLKLDEVDFFSLASDGRCVYYLARPLAPSKHSAGTTYMDYDRKSVSVRLHGVSTSISTSLRGGPPTECLYDSMASNALDSFLKMIMEVGRQVPLVTPTPTR